MSDIRLKKKKCTNYFPYRKPTNAFGEFLRMQTLNSKGVVNTKTFSNIWKNCNEDVKSVCRQVADDRMKTYKELKQKYEMSRLKRPRCGYILFVQNFVNLNKGLYNKISQTVSEAAKIWKNLDPEEKEKWREAGISESEKYFAEKKRRIESGEDVSLKSGPIAKKPIPRRGSSENLLAESGRATSSTLRRCRKRVHPKKGMKKKNSVKRRRNPTRF